MVNGNLQGKRVSITSIFREGIIQVRKLISLKSAGKRGGGGRMLLLKSVGERGEGGGCFKQQKYPWGHGMDISGSTHFK